MIRGIEKDEIDFSRRHLLVGGGQAAVFTILLARLQYLQIAQSDVYSTLSDANRINVVPLAPPRGQILDRHGIILAENDHNLQVEIIPEQVADLRATIAYLAKILDFSEARQRDLLQTIKRQPSFRATRIAENLSWRTFARLNLQLPFMTGVAPRVGDKRIYHYGETAAHVVGYMGGKTARDIRTFGATPAANVGRSGIERKYEATLRGRAGVRQLEVNAYGRTVRELAGDAGAAGADLRLTLDIRLQDFAAKRLGRRSGAIVVLDATSGEVLTLVSNPSFNANQLSHGIDTQDWNRLLAHDRKPLLNKAIGGLFAPGSTFKMIVALAALEAGVVSPDEEFVCDGTFTLADELFHCWKKEGHGAIAMEGAIAQSCDTYFYEVALRTGIDHIERMAKRFGFGQKLGLDLAGEKSGTMPGRDWKRANYDTSWRAGETVITGIGQGFVLTTPLQLARMTAILANGGKAITPFIVQPSNNGTNATSGAGADIGLPSAHLRLVQRALYGAVNRADGTGYGSSLLVNGARMSGKTGTVQVRRISSAERETGVFTNRELDWHLRDHALFVGYAPHNAPRNAPRYAISVVVEHGGAGAQVAAPIARDVMVHLLSLKPAPQPFVPTNKQRAG